MTGSTTPSTSRLQVRVMLRCFNGRRCSSDGSSGAVCAAVPVAVGALSSGDVLEVQLPPSAARRGEADEHEGDETKSGGISPHALANFFLELTPICDAAAGNPAAAATCNTSERRLISTAVQELLNASEGAPALAALLGSVAQRQWVPAHAVELLASCPQLNLFEERPPATTPPKGSDNGGGSTPAAAPASPSSAPSLLYCVARKKAKPLYHRRCPRIETTLRINGILQRAVLGEPAWKQCGATFSTMMRHFQKSPAMFKWTTDGEKHTVIQQQASAPASRH